MNIEEQIEFYDNYWTHKKLNNLSLRRFIKILDYFTIVKKQFKTPHILDLGCGDGRLTALLGEFGTAVGVELSEKAVTVANKLYPHVKFFQGNALEYELDKEYYDLVISQEVLEHVWEQDKYLEVCFNALKPGGYLILTTPNKQVLDHMTNGNQWSNQPIENVLVPKQLKKLVSIRFTILKYDSIVMNFGNRGIYRFINFRYFIGLANRFGLKGFREYFLGKLGYGLHQCILAKKAN